MPAFFWKKSRWGSYRQCNWIHFGSLVWCATYDASLSKCRLTSLKNKSENITFKLAQLPPTLHTERLHGKRTYFHIQQWNGNVLNPLQWGWKSIKNGLIPIISTMPPTPQGLLERITCKYSKGCQANCGCRKSIVKMHMFPKFVEKTYMKK